MNVRYKARIAQFVKEQVQQLEPEIIDDYYSKNQEMKRSNIKVNHLFKQQEYDGLNIPFNMDDLNASRSNQVTSRNKQREIKTPITNIRSPRGADFPFTNPNYINLDSYRNTSRMGGMATSRYGSTSRRLYSQGTARSRVTSHLNLR